MKILFTNYNIIKFYLFIENFDVYLEYIPLHLDSQQILIENLNYYYEYFSIFNHSQNVCHYLCYLCCFIDYIDFSLFLLAKQIKKQMDHLDLKKLYVLRKILTTTITIKHHLADLIFFIFIPLRSQIQKLIKIYHIHLF